jgi:hypothetical protein
MFEIAATLAAAKRNHLTPCFIRDYDVYYKDIPAFQEYILPILDDFKKYDNIRFIDYVEPADFSFKPIVVDKSTRLVGYFTSSLYFDDYRNFIIDTFITNTNQVNNLEHTIRLQYPGRQFVSVHVRRTDYVVDYGWGLPVEYYQKAAEHFDKPVYVIFSDDHEFCKEQLTFMEDKIFVNEKDYIELLLMGRFDAHICANSTFSAMGIILGDRHRNKKVIAPKQWTPGHFNPNIFEKHWIQI